MNWEELQKISINDYKLAAYFCRTSYAKGGVCTYALKSLKVGTINIETQCKEKDLELAAIKLSLNSSVICVITIYRAPSGNFNLFINKLDTILRHLYNPALEFIICGDVNIDYLQNTEKKKSTTKSLIILQSY